MHLPDDHREEQLRVLFMGCWEGDATYATLDKEGNIELKTKAL